MEKTRHTPHTAKSVRPAGRRGGTQRRREEQYRLLFETHPCPMWVFERETRRVLAVNDAAVANYGYTREEFLALSIADLRAPEERPRLEAALRGVPDGEHRAGVFAHRRKDGGAIWADVSSQPVTFGGRACRMVTAQDVTARREAEEGLRRSHALLRAVTEGIDDALYVKDLQGRYRLINAAGARAIGRPVGDILGRTDADLFPPETARRTRAHDERVLSAGRRETYEDTEPGAGGRTFLSSKGVFRDAGGGVAGVYGISRDVTARRRAEEALRDRERQMQTVTDNVPAMIARIDAGERYLFCNAAYQAMTGLAPARIVGRSLADVLGPAAYAVIAPHVRRVFAGEAVTYEARVVFPRGGPRTVRVSYVPERGTDGGVCGFVLAATDITERQRAEEDLRRAEAKYRGLFENAVEGIFQSRPGGGFFSVNPALVRMLGYDSADELLALVSDLGTQVYADPTERAEMLRVFQAQGMVSNHELQVRRRDGTTFWVSLSARAVRDEATGGVAYIDGRAVDVTEKRQARRALRESEARFRSAFDGASIGMCLTDDRGRYLQINRALCDMVGYSEAEMMASGFAAITHPDDIAADLDCYDQLLDGSRDAYSMEKRYLHKSGRLVWVHLSVSSVRDAQSRTPYIIAQIQDITERRTLEEERRRLLRRTEELLEDALARADRDPLTGLLNHRAFHERLEEEADRAGRAGVPLAVAMMDLDNFKFFNDAYGHPTGDDVLRRIAQTLQGCARPGDAVARFGGDEFALILPGLDAEAAEDRVRRMCDRVADAGYRPDGCDAPLPVALSAGVAAWPQDHAAPLGALERADERLCRRKSGAEDSRADDIRARMGRSLEGFSMLDALVTAVDNKDRYTRRHSEDVLAYSLQIAEGLGLDEDTRQTVAVAALLHDVGKIGVPDKILRKPGKLTDAEFAAVQNHPMMGAVIVAAVPGLEGTLDAVRHHHERWDGGGYPFGLRGDETPLIARLMAVADAFSAMTTDRPYRKGMAEAKALSIIEAGAGTQWDPACVRAFLRARRPSLAKAA